MNTANALIDRFQIVGFVLSALMSIGLIVSGQDTIASVLLGLVLSVLIQLFDLQLRNSSDAQQLLQANSLTENRLLRATALTEKLYRNDALLQRIEAIVNDYYEVQNHQLELFDQYAQYKIKECQYELHKLAEGVLQVPNNTPVSFSFQGIEEATESLKAVTSGNYAYWNSKAGRTLIVKNSQVASRGIKITRIFIEERATLAHMIDILNEQRQAGIEVYIAYLESVPQKYQTKFLLLDDRVVAFFDEASMIKNGQEITYTREERISSVEAEVEVVVSNFEKLIQRHAIKLEDAIDELKSSVD